MKIAQINPGLLPIPPNGWGAVEKIIWEYSLVLKELGHNVDIKYLDDIREGEYDIVHVHMANLALELRDRGIPYIFSMHDHHVVWFGKDSECYKKNLEAIEGSLISFVHAKFLIGHFESKKAVYLEHGVNIKEYSFVERNPQKHKLLCLANNGIIGDQSYDRKGFRYAIEAAWSLNLPITIAGPSNNKNFFEKNRDLLGYGGLTLLYDLDQEESVKLFSEHDIFLHPSDLEAGHPNLTLLEAASTGMPIVGCMEENMKGLILAQRDKISVQEKIREAIDSYPQLSRASRENAEYHSWEVVVSKMLEVYEDALGWDMGRKLLENYRVTPIKKKKTLSADPFIVKFNLQPDYIKVNTEISIPGAGVSVIYKNGASVRNFLDHFQESRRWSAVNNFGEWCDWEIVFKNGSEVLKSVKMDLTHKLVGVSVRDEFDLITMLKFQKDFNCQIIIIGSLEDEQKMLLREHQIPFSSNSSNLDFWFSYETLQNWRNTEEKNVQPEKTLILLRSNALGDTLAFIESCQAWKEKWEKTPTVGINPAFIEIFKSYDLEIVDKNSVNHRNFTDIILSDYHFDIELQHGFQKDLGLDLVKRRPDLKFKPSIKPIQGRYVCFSTHSTAQAKYWNYPSGWEILCKMLRKAGITPVCIDRYEMFGTEGHWNPVPKSSVKRLGLLFPELMNFIHHAEFYIGLSSGHSWLAHSLRKKVVMITGATVGEFEEDNHRIQNTSVCHGCFNKPDHNHFDATDWMWCPINKGTDREHECTKVITPEEVFAKITELL
jgi:autotransporter strand-loop-strand O-heptosyltransferase